LSCKHSKIILQYAHSTGSLHSIVVVVLTISPHTNRGRPVCFSEVEEALHIEIWSELVYVEAFISAREIE
jgi:hypothetical protein